MGFPLFPLVWNARSKSACSSEECYLGQFPNMDQIWGLISTCARLAAPSYLYLIIYPYDLGVRRLPIILGSGGLTMSYA